MPNTPDGTSRRRRTPSDAAADNSLDYPAADAVEAAFGRLPETCDLEGDESAFTTAKAERDLGWTPAYSWREAETEDVPEPTR